MHGPVPEQSPPNPAKVLPASAEAVSVTTVPSSKTAEQVAPQSIPAGLLVTVPLPLPAFETVSVHCRMKVAVTSRSELIVTVHGPVPEQSPDQPPKRLPGAGVAVRVTTAPSPKDSEQSRPQSIPPGLLVTVPLPTVDTVKTGSSVKVAVTE